MNRAHSSHTGSSLYLFHYAFHITADFQKDFGTYTPLCNDCSSFEPRHFHQQAYIPTPLFPHAGIVSIIAIIVLYFEHKDEDDEVLHAKPLLVIRNVLLNQVRAHIQTNLLPLTFCVVDWFLPYLFMDQFHH
jgi:hypothetical protein